MTPSAPLAEERRLTRLYRAFWTYSRGDRPGVVAFVSMLLLAQLLRLAIPYLSGAAVEAMEAKGDAGLASAAWDMALIFAVCVGAWMLHGPGRVLERFIAIRIRQRFADGLYAKTAALPLDWHERQHSGETIEKVQKAGTALFGFAQSQFVYLQNGVSLLGPIAAIFVISLPTGMAALAAYAIIAVVLLRFDGTVIRLNREQNAAQARYTASLVDCLGNIATVLTLRLQAPTRRLLGTRLDAVFAPLRSNIVINETKWAAVDLLNNGSRCFLAVFYAWLAWRQGSPVLLGAAVMVYQYAQQAGNVVTNMASNYQELVSFQTDLECAGGVLAAHAPLASSAAVSPDWRALRVEALSFAFPAREGHALSDIALSLSRGERLALVGESGSGKSTLLRVLAGLYTAERARFSVDGMPRPDLAHLGSIATLAPQDPEIFEGSIGHNLTLGLDYPPTAVRRACDLAHFTPVAEALPAGLATNIAERGLNLSGGQKQRLALARALLAARGSSLLLLDEPTSSVDPRTEARIYDNLLAAMGEATIVSSLHRLHLLDRFDRVVLMDEGRILATGTPSELFARVPLFRELWLRYGGDSDAPRPGSAAWRVAAARS
jgi:ABC-type multidrug transport system fused ATPase/permease subunit